MSSGNMKKAVLAGAFAMVGVVLAWRALDRADRREQIAPAPRHVPAETALRVSPEVLDTTPTPETAAQIVQELTRRARPQMDGFSGTLGPGGNNIGDLAQAFSDLFGASLTGDYERSAATLVARGYSAAHRDRDDWEKAALSATMGRLGTQGVEVRLLYRHGRPVTPIAPPESGWSYLTMTPSAKLMPVPADPERGMLDVVEVRFPIERKTADTCTLETVLLGYRFAWSRERKQWVPYQTCIYSSSDHAHFTVSF